MHAFSIEQYCMALPILFQGLEVGVIPQEQQLIQVSFLSVVLLILLCQGR